VVSDTADESLNRLEPPEVVDGKVVLRYLGIPHRTYRVERTTNLSAPVWQTG
jgi:hypothetical protein